MQTNDFLKFARETMDEHGLNNWKLKLDSAVGRNGQCDHGTKTLSFSKHFIQLNSQEMILNILLHEIAHSLVGSKHGHDWVWEQKCKQIGYSNPSRCSNSNMPKGKYQAKCPNCGPINAFRHRLSNKKQIHVACKSSVKWEELIY